MAATDLSRYYERTRTKGVNRAIFWTVRVILGFAIQIYFSLERGGRKNIPKKGPVILASNHRSFLDPFVIGCCVRRPVYFVAKKELFEKRWQGWLLNRLGAFPVKRGESDEESVATAKQILARGDVVVIFPEGTRHRTGSLAKPKRGVGRLALESGAPVVPVAVTGSERARRGWRIRPVKVKVRCGRPLTFPRVEESSRTLAEEVTARIWPCVELQWEWLGGLPPLRKAAVVGAGSMGTGVAALLARAGIEVQLGCRTAAQAAKVASAERNDDYLPTVSLPDGVTTKPLSQIEFAGVDLVVFAVPSSALPSAVANVGARIGDRSAVLVVSKGIVAPQGTLPSLYVSERVNARAVACLGGPCHAAEAVESGASVVLASRDDDFRQQLGEALERAGLDVERSTDVPGVELAGAAKNAAALAAAAAAVSGGMNAAGAAAARVFAEIETLAARHGAHPDTFTGLAGTGDLVATVMARHSRNRQAGELLADGMPAERIPAALGEEAEALHSVPLIAELCAREGVDAPATAALADLIEGRVAPAAWVEQLRGGARAAA